MLDDNTLQERIARLFSDILSIDIPSTDTDLFDTGVLDSLAFVELLLHLEREFGVTTSVDDLAIDNFRSIVRIANYVMARTAAPSDTFARPRIVRVGT
jgi:methoxymalonate biosynthesis acyl carrier protein